MDRIRQKLPQLAFLLVVLGAQPLAAQVSYPGVPTRSNPYQPRLSPYLNLLRNDNSLLTPYHSFLQPRREFQQQQLQLYTEVTGIAQSRHIQNPGISAGHTRLPTGNGGQFQSYLHFYPLNNQRPYSRF